MSSRSSSSSYADGLLDYHWRCLEHLDPPMIPVIHDSSRWFRGFGTLTASQAVPDDRMTGALVHGRQRQCQDHHHDPKMQSIQDLKDYLSSTKRRSSDCGSVGFHGRSTSVGDDRTRNWTGVVLVRHRILYQGVGVQRSRGSWNGSDRGGCSEVVETKDSEWKGPALSL